MNRGYVWISSFVLKQERFPYTTNHYHNVDDGGADNDRFNEDGDYGSVIGGRLQEALIPPTPEPQICTVDDYSDDKDGVCVHWVVRPSFYPI